MAGVRRQERQYHLRRLRDLDLAAEKAAFGICFNQGEVCSANSRLLVERPIYAAFIAKLQEKMQAGLRRIRSNRKAAWGPWSAPPMPKK